jgi:hypothetical protein
MSLKNHKNLHYAERCNYGLSFLGNSPLGKRAVTTKKDFASLKLPAWFIEAKTQNLIISKDDYGKIICFGLVPGDIYWRGSWLEGHWHGASMRNVSFVNGVWHEGHFLFGEWENGEFCSGMMENSMWRKGTVYDGYFKTITWNNGLWKHGLMENSQWYDGIWVDGHWVKGKWGKWHKGIWAGGTYNKKKCLGFAPNGKPILAATRNIKNKEIKCITK